MNNIKNCLLCGVGGQGTVLASKLIAYNAMKQGKKVRTSETIGMAQRGGCVVSHVRYGGDIDSPLIPLHSADVIIAFEPAEAVRNIEYLSDDGVVIVNKRAIMPINANFGGAKYEPDTMLEWLKNNVKKVIIIDGEEICSKCGSSKVLNIVLLAYAAKTGMLGMSVEELKSSVCEKVNPKFVELNLKAIELCE